MVNVLRCTSLVGIIASLCAPLGHYASAADPGACFQTCRIEINFPADQCFSYCRSQYEDSYAYGYGQPVEGYYGSPTYGYISPPSAYGYSGYGYRSPTYGYRSQSYREEPVYGYAYRAPACLE